VLLPVLMMLAAPAADFGPSAAQLADAIRETPHEVGRGVRLRPAGIRALRCSAFEEEPTEFRCRFSALDRRGRRRRHVAIIAIEGPRWILLYLVLAQR